MTERPPRLTPVLVLLVGGLVVALVGLPPAAADTQRPGPPSDPAALRLLAAAVQAQNAVAYEGVQFVSAWGRSGSVSQVVNITHVPHAGTVVRVGGTPAEPGVEVFSGAAEPGRPTALLARNYALSVHGSEQVAGRDCVVIEARRSGGSLAARFWLDEETALMLRREVYDAAGEAIKASSFVEITIGRPTQWDGHLPPAAPRTTAERLPLAAADRLRADGWTVPAAFQPGLTLSGVGTSVGESGAVVHLSYSDGLSAVSLFEQRGHLNVRSLSGLRKVEIDGTPVYVAQGIPYRATWSADGVVYTIVADAPEEVVHAAIVALPRERRDDDVLSRVGRGMTRIASWFNPFG